MYKLNIEVEQIKKNLPRISSLSTFDNMSSDILHLPIHFHYLPVPPPTKKHTQELIGFVIPKNHAKGNYGWVYFNINIYTFTKTPQFFSSMFKKKNQLCWSWNVFADFFRNLQVSDWKCVSGPFHPNKAPTLVRRRRIRIRDRITPRKFQPILERVDHNPLVLSMVIHHVFSRVGMILSNNASPKCFCDPN